MKANPNYTYLQKYVPVQRVVNLQGGTRSGKTFSVIYYLIWLCSKYKGLEIDIVRETFKSLKATVWKDFEEVLNDLELYSETNHNKTDHTYNLNGNLISYYGVDDDAKVHGRKRDILWINEANQVDGKTYDQLSPRTKHRIINDFNPALGDESWLDPLLEEYPPLITTYKDNPHLTDSQIKDIESKKNQSYWWSVYGQGIRAKREGVIFQNWERGEFDTSLPFHYGLDFGFVNDPDACVKVAIDDKRSILYLEEMFYEYAQKTDDLARQIDKLERGLIIADSAEQRLINSLQSKTNRGIRPVKKGKGSVLSGIKMMENYKIVVCGKSPHLVKELNNYAWSNKGKDYPIDDFNHLIDAVRYVVFSYSNQHFIVNQYEKTTHSEFGKGNFTGADAAPWLQNDVNDESGAISV